MYVSSKVLKPKIVLSSKQFVVSKALISNAVLKAFCFVEKHLTTEKKVRL
jgi:hypothetical protein